jgi:citrate lyase beta subunit
MSTTSLSLDALQGTLSRLRGANLGFAMRARAPAAREPVHTVYGGAHLFKADTAQKLGAVALRAMAEHAPDFVAFARALGLPGEGALPERRAEIAALSAALERDPGAVRRAFRPAWLAHAVYARVLDKLRREPVEDLRIDFEDGYGARPDGEEDEHAAAAAREVARGMAERTLPPSIGLRIKSLGDECLERSLRTLDIFLTTLVSASGGALPPGFVVTLPKVTVVEQITALVDVLEHLERALGVPDGSLKLELMVETTAAIIGQRGEIALPLWLDAARGRCVAAHFGAYDYTASCDITAADQHLAHPACDFARHVMQVALTGAGVRLSDGATNILPVAPHRAAPGGALSSPQVDENRRAVHGAWRLQYEHVRRSLSHGYYQGWDLHPAQLPVRYAAVHAFFLEGVEVAAGRLRSFVDRAARATVAGTVFDDAATGQGLLNFFLRAISAGAMTEAEAAEESSLTPDELRGRSFLAIVQNRTA